MATVASLNVLFSANMGGFSSGLRKGGRDLQGFIGTATLGLRNLAATAGLAFGAFQVVQEIKEAVGVFMDFEATMSRVKALTNANEAEFKALGDKAIELGQKTIFS